MRCHESGIFFCNTSCDSLWKHEPSINENVSVIDSDQHAVHANLTKAPYWKNPEGRTLTRWGPWEGSVRLSV